MLIDLHRVNLNITSVKRVQFLANVDNFSEFDDNFSNTAKKSS